MALSDPQALVLLYSLPLREVLEARAQVPQLPAKDLYASLFHRVRDTVGPRALRALGLPEYLESAEDCSQWLLAFNFPYVLTSQHHFELADGAQQTAQLLTASLALELKEKPQLQDVWRVTSQLPKERLALALFYPSRCRADALNFLDLELLLTESFCEPSLLQASVASHKAYMRWQRSLGLRPPPVVTARLMCEALDGYEEVDESAFEDLRGYVSPEDSELCRLRLRAWRALNGRLSDAWQTPALVW